MLNRWIGILSLFAMILANAFLVLRDVAPGWLAGAPPDADADLRPGDLREAQLDIFDADGNRIGQSWTISRMTNAALDVQTTTLLEPIRLPNALRTPRVRVDTDLSYRQSAVVDHLEVRIFGLGALAQVRGELFEPGDFSCQWSCGEMNGSFLLPADATRALSDVFRPFDRLPGLYVGRSWRMRVMNPLAQIVPGWQGSFSVDESLVRVTRKESITIADVPHDCFVVESSAGRAWADAKGEVLRQEIDLPLLGRLTLERRPFDKEARNAARAAFQVTIPALDDPAATHRPRRRP